MENETDFPSVLINFARVQNREIAVIHHDGPVACFFGGKKEFKKRGFSGSIGTQKTHNLPGFHSERNIFHHLAFFEGFRTEFF